MPRSLGTGWRGRSSPISAGSRSKKNIGAFLTLDLPGSKVVVGDGPARAALQRAHPEVLFTGARYGTELARSFAGADVFVFPSRTDTFGLVILESLASGTPVAAFRVTGPKDVLLGGSPAIGTVDTDLRRAALAALAHGDRTACRRYAERFSWLACAEVFLDNLVPLAAANAIGRSSIRARGRST